MHSSRMRTGRSLNVFRRLLLGGGRFVWYLVRGGVPGPGGVCLVPGVVPGPGGCAWSWGVYLVPGGVPGPGGCLVQGGVPGPGGCTWSRGGVYLVLGGWCTWSRGDVPGPGGVYLVWGGAWSGNPPCEQNE